MSVTSKNNAEFWADYIIKKQAVFSRLEGEVTDEVRLQGEAISCHDGCFHCCFVYVEATLKECMAIAYHISQNNLLLNSFLNKYPDWLQKTDQYRERCRKALSEARKQNQSSTIFREMVDALLFYKLQNTACPFLLSGSCSIYPARPFACAAHFVTTPAEWCRPRDARNPKVYKGSFADEMADLSIDGKKLDDPGITLMPLKVYEILVSQAVIPHQADSNTGKF